MKLLGLFLVAVTATVFISSDAHALRMRNQQKRIENGRESGQLTKVEARELRLQGKAIKIKRQELKADGKLDVQDRLELRKLRKERSQNIRKLKHNDVTKQSAQCQRAKEKAKSMRFSSPDGLQNYLAKNGC
jgi:hypothetical protein